MTSMSSSLILKHLHAELNSLTEEIPAAGLRSSVLRLIEVQNGFRKLCVAIAVENGCRATGAKDRIRQYLMLNANQVIDGEELAVVSGISEYARRVRELRDDDGLNISSGPARDPRTSLPLRPNQYFLALE